MQPYHLHSKHPVTRSQTTTRCYTLSEEGMPKGDGLATSLLDIVKYLDPKNSPRYGRSAHFTHLFAADVCYLAGAYLPILWYQNTDKPEGVKIQMNSLAIWEWYKDFGFVFGWHEVPDFKIAQEYADIGHIVTIIALPKSISGRGQMSIILPSIHKYELCKNSFSKDAPPQSRGGHEFLQTKWYKGPKYSDFKIYVNFLK